MNNNAVANNQSFIKRHKVLLIVLSVLVVLFVVLPVLVMGWFGFFPGVSNVMGSRDARDLGVTYTPADLASYNQKANVELLEYSQAPPDPNNPGEKLMLASFANANNTVITQEELTAKLNEDNWAWYPAKNIQARISDGTLEISGNVDSAGLAQLNSYVDQQTGNVTSSGGLIDFVNTFAEDIPFYVKAELAVAENVLTYRIVEVEVGRLDVPFDWLSTTTQIDQPRTVKFAAEGVNINSAKLSNGTLTFTGSYPTKIYIK